jgi:antitoxin (DNA-binding transcriptional repressor) of toxin-antitoxin stability system
MRVVGIQEAKSHFSDLLNRVIAGEDIVIAKRGRPVARLVRFIPSTGKRVLGSERGKFVVPDDFDSPLPKEALSDFEGSK